MTREEEMSRHDAVMAPLLASWAKVHFLKDDFTELVQEIDAEGRLHRLNMIPIYYEEAARDLNVTLNPSRPASR